MNLFHFPFPRNILPYLLIPKHPILEIKIEANLYFSVTFVSMLAEKIPFFVILRESKNETQIKNGKS